MVPMAVIAHLPTSFCGGIGRSTSDGFGGYQPRNQAASRRRGRRAGSSTMVQNSAIRVAQGELPRTLIYPSLAGCLLISDARADLRGRRKQRTTKFVAAGVGGP